MEIIQRLKNMFLKPDQYKEGSIDSIALDESYVELLKSQVEMDEYVIDFNGMPTWYSHGPSFLHSWKEIFVDEAYRFIPNTKKPLIIDGGANIGLSTLYFALRHPNAIIHAFEPDPFLFKMLEKNIRIHQQKIKASVHLHQEALWIANKKLTFFNEGALAGSLVGDFGKTQRQVEVSAVDIKNHLNKKVALLKLDVEGAEHALLPHIEKKLAKIDHLFFEYHSIQNEEQKLGSFLMMLNRAGFRYHISEAAKLSRQPMVDKLKVDRLFDLQLNIWCYRVK